MAISNLTGGFMTTKKLFMLLTSVLLLAFSVSAQPAINWFPDEIDFGTVPIRTTASVEVYISSIGTEPLQVTAHAEGTGFNVPTDEMITLMPGDSGFVAVEFSPQDQIVYTGTLFLTTNDPQHASIEISLTGSGGLPAIGSLLVSVADINSDPVVGADVELYSFALNGVIGNYTTNASGQVMVQELDAGGYRVSVEAEDFRPQFQDIVIWGNLQTSILFQMMPSLDDPTIYVNEQVNFGMVPVGFFQNAYLPVMNLGSELLTVDASISGDAFEMPSPAHFEIANADTEFVIDLIFRPQHEGTFNGTLTLASNDPENPTVYVALSGTSAELGEGNIEGIVVVDDPVEDTPVEDALVILDYIRGGNGITGPHLTAYTDEFGAFSFTDVVWGVYSLTASKPGYGFASEIVSIEEDQTTHTTLTLLSPAGSDSDSVVVDPTLEPIELSGTAIVEEPNEDHNITWYFLDVDNNGVPDYQLSFGPPWYEPGSGATRPENGDHIEISGGLMSYASPPLVVVYMINGQAWSNTPGGGGHGGYAGDWLFSLGCDPNNVSWIELNGTAQSYMDSGLAYRGIDTDEDNEADYILEYGTNYGYWDLIPEDGEAINIIGGLVNCDLSEYGLLPVVIVYEINSEPWRVPGDTTGMGPLIPIEITDVFEGTVPTEFEVAQNYPNPFNPVTTIEFTIPAAGFVDLKIYDITGREVASLFRNDVAAGRYSVEWNGVSAPSGLYFYRVSYGEQQITRRMLLLK